MPLKIASRNNTPENGYATSKTKRGDSDRGGLKEMEKELVRRGVGYALVSEEKEDTIIDGSETS